VTKTESLEEFFGCSQYKRRVSGHFGGAEKGLPISTGWCFFLLAFRDDIKCLTEKDTKRNCHFTQ